jgi:hypothetical protein
MGAGAITRTFEVSFVDKERGEILSDDDKIKYLTKEAKNIIFQDFQPSFYDAYKDTKKFAYLAKHYVSENKFISQNISVKHF